MTLPLLNCTGERDILLSACSLVQAGVEYVDEHGEQRMALPKERLEHSDTALRANFPLTLPMCHALIDEAPHAFDTIYASSSMTSIKFKKALHKF